MLSTLRAVSELIMPRIAPSVRILRVSARASTPAIALTRLRVK